MPILAVTLLAGAFLLFLVQPLMGAFVLPWFGGAPAVWTTCMLFFQSLLLGGYAYAHGLARWPLRRQAAVHAAVVLAAILTLPIAPDPSWRPEAGQAPVLHILGLLAVSVGLPYLVLSSTSTLMQAWAARLYPGSPYKLYAGSNAASMAALFAYPLLLEPWIGAQAQSTAWSWAFGGFALASLASASVAWRGGAGGQAAHHEPGPPTPLPTVLAWIGLAAVPSALLLAVTEQITADVSVVPFFWVVPLALYLLTFIVVFAQEQEPSPQRVAVAAALGAVCFLPVHIWPGLPLITQVGLGSGGLFLLALALHTELVRRRPPPARLTGFYLAMSFGGALGGLAVAVVAPALLNTRIELPILLLLTPLALALAHRRTAWTFAVSLAVVGTGVALTQEGEVEARYRSFYGSVRVELQRPRGPDGPVVRHLVDGRVSHGFQALDNPRTPMGYYGPGTGINRAFAALTGPRKVGVFGLGGGTLAAFGRAGDDFRFYEYNPDVIEVAEQRFTYLKDTPAKTTVVAGDARLALAAEAPNGFDLLILDAFSGDAVPTHLLTREAFDLYRSHLKPGGILAIHVSNHHLELSLLVYGQIKALGWASKYIKRQAPSPLGPYLSKWMIAGPPERLQALGLKPNAPPALDEGRVPPVWTDDHSPLWPLLR